MVPPCSDRISRVPPYSRLMFDVTCTGLSPATARLSRRFQLSSQKRWPGPRSLVTTNGVSVDVLSSRYLDISVPWVRLFTPMYSGKDTSLITRSSNPTDGLRHPAALRILAIEVGCPIRKSTDQSLFAAPRGLSQRTTSFIASCRQGIHQMPLSRLIALIINAHPSAEDGQPGRLTNRALSKRPDHSEKNPAPARLLLWPIGSRSRGPRLIPSSRCVDDMEAMLPQSRRCLRNLFSLLSANLRRNRCLRSG